MNRLRYWILAGLLSSSFVLSLLAEDVQFQKTKSALSETEQEILLINKIVQGRNKAREYFFNGDYTRSVVEYQALLKINPGDAIAKRELEMAKSASRYLEDAKIAFAEKNYEQVITAVTQLKSLNPNDAAGAQFMANAQQVLKAQQEAETYFNQGQFRLAILSYNEILKRVPNDQDALGNIKSCSALLEARTLFSNGNYQQSMSKYRQVLSLRPKNMVLLNELKMAQDAYESQREARVSFAEHHYKEAAVYYQQLMDLNPQDPEAKQKRDTIRGVTDKVDAADAAFQKGAYKPAVQLYEEAKKLDPASQEISDKISLARKAGKFQDEGKDFFKHSPTQLKEYGDVVNRILEEDDRERSRQREEALTKEFINYRTEARQRFSEGDYNAAQVLYKQSLSINPLDERLQQELKNCNRAIDLQTKGKELFATGKYDEAKELYRQLMALTPESQNSLEVVVQDVAQAENKDFSLMIFEPSDKQIVYEYFVDVKGAAKGADEVMVNNIRVKTIGDHKYFLRLPLYQIGKNLVSVSVQRGDQSIERRFRILRLASFNDVDPQQAYDMGVIATLGLLTGDSQGNFRGGDSLLQSDFINLLYKINPQLSMSQTGKYVTRKEAARMLARLLGLIDSSQSQGAVSMIKDLSSNDPDYAAVLSVLQNGIMPLPDNGFFRPNDYLKRQEVVALLLNIPEVRRRVKDLINWDEGF